MWDVIHLYVGDMTDQRRERTEIFDSVKHDLTPLIKNIAAKSAAQPDLQKVCVCVRVCLRV